MNQIKRLQDQIETTEKVVQTTTSKLKSVEDRSIKLENKLEDEKKQRAVDISAMDMQVEATKRELDLQKRKADAQVRVRFT